jgi:hypothetical protein
MVEPSFDPTESAPTPASIDFYFDFIAPLLPSRECGSAGSRGARHDASIDHRPFYLLDLMKIVDPRIPK